MHRSSRVTDTVAGSRARVAAGRVAVAGAVTAAVAMSVALGLGGGAGGSVTSVAVPVLRLAGDFAAVGCLGAVLAAVLLLPADGRRLGAQGARAVRDAGVAAGVWSVASLASAGLTAAVILGVPVWRLGSRLGELSSISQVWSLAVSSLLAAVLGVMLTAVRSVPAAAAALAVAVAAVVPPLLTGHAAAGAVPVLATGSLVVHVLAATAWVGGLAAVAGYGRLLGPALPASVDRFSRLALGCAVAVGLTGVVTAGIHWRVPAAGSAMHWERSAPRTGWWYWRSRPHTCCWSPPAGGTGAGRCRAWPPVRVASSGGWSPSNSW